MKLVILMACSDDQWALLTEATPKLLRLLRVHAIERIPAINPRFPSFHTNLGWLQWGGRL